MMSTVLSPRDHEGQQRAEGGRSVGNCTRCWASGCLAALPLRLPYKLTSTIWCTSRRLPKTGSACIANLNAVF